VELLRLLRRLAVTDNKTETFPLRGPGAVMSTGGDYKSPRSKSSASAEAAGFLREDPRRASIEEDEGRSSPGKYGT
jgi:hypothetical protein